MGSRFRSLLVTSLVLAPISAARASDDWQYWNQLAFKHEFNDKVALDIASEQKWLDDASDFFLYNIFIVPTVKLTEDVSVGAGYRCERRKEDDSWTTENRLLFPLTVGWTVKPWLLQLRSQLEYRDLEDEQDRWRIRERILLKRPMQVGHLTMTPFVSAEVFYDFTVEQVNQNRIAVGLSLPLRKDTTWTLFYMNRAERCDDWSTANVLSSEIAFTF